MVIKHVGCSSICMNLADSVGTFCAIVHGIGFECWHHDLVSNTAVVVTTPLVFAQVVLINQGLSLFSEALQIHHNGNRWKRVLLKDQASWQHATSFVDAHPDGTLR